MTAMQRRIVLGLALILALYACEGTTDKAPGSDEEPMMDEAAAAQIWVANRAEGTISVIDTQTDGVLETIALPAGSEPMYVNYSATNEVVFVGDRGFDGVRIFDARTRELLDTVDTGEGVFHQWTVAAMDQIWINNDIDRTTTVIDTGSNEVLAQISMPTDLADMPAEGDGTTKPHDVLVSPDGAAAYVSYVGFEGENDYVVRFDTSTFEETDRAAVGKDPHLSATMQNDVLYVPCQGNDEVFVLQRANLELVSRTAIPGAHGAGMTHSGDHFYVTNTPGGGDAALFVMETASHEALHTDGVDAPMIGNPHNIALAGDDQKIYVTHSGPEADVVSVFEVSEDDPVPGGVTAEISVGANPFGLGYVPALPER